MAQKHPPPPQILKNSGRFHPVMLNVEYFARKTLLACSKDSAMRKEYTSHISEATNHWNLIKHTYKHICLTCDSLTFLEHWSSTSRPLKILCLAENSCMDLMTELLVPYEAKAS